jgi:hypothetical protein
MASTIERTDIFINHVIHDLNSISKSNHVLDNVSIVMSLLNYMYFILYNDKELLNYLKNKHNFFITTVIKDIEEIYYKIDDYENSLSKRLREKIIIINSKIKFLLELS